MSDFINVTADESAAFNKVLGDNADSGPSKSVPYIGWYWREVDFTRPFTLGHCGEFVGFMENNKWGYPEWTVTPAQYHAAVVFIRGMFLDRGVTPDRLAAFYEMIQSFDRANARQDAIDQKEENARMVDEINATNAPTMSISDNM